MSNIGIDYVKNADKYYQPKTPFSTLKAVTDGLLPPEAFIYKASSIDPIADNPENLEEIERILGQKNRDLKTNLLLKQILDKLIKHPDKEIALFAAESINAIENEYNRAVEKLEKDGHRKRALLYTELAELNRDVTDLRNFYLREAFAGYRKLQTAGEAGDEDLLNMSRILIGLNMLSPAAKILYSNKIKGIEARLIMAEIAFRQRNYTRLYFLMADLDKHRSRLNSEQTELIDFWMEGI
ncbi:MAG TPA: hypothetical protein DCO79_08765 [Spirochaeta sp.]|nr:hypothetical protein [Spirochaeta sp.]